MNIHCGKKYIGYTQDNFSIKDHLGNVIVKHGSNLQLEDESINHITNMVTSYLDRHYNLDEDSFVDICFSKTDDIIILKGPAQAIFDLDISFIDNSATVFVTLVSLIAV